MALKTIEKVVIDKKSYDLYVGIREIMQYEKLYRLETGNRKATFIKSLPLLEEGDMTVIGCMLASMLHKEDKKQSVGWSVVEEINIFSRLPEIMEKLMSVISDDAIIEPDEEEESYMGKIIETAV